jgi:hypothetical protein
VASLARINVLLLNKRLKRALDRVSARHDRPMPAATPREEALVAELRRRIRALEGSPVGDEQPSERVWRRFIEQFHDAMGREDPRGFLRWPTIAKAMFVTNQPYLSIELLSLRARRDWRRRWRPALREFPVGHPVPFWACHGAAAISSTTPTIWRSSKRGPDARPTDSHRSSSSAGAMAACVDCFTS